MRTWTPNGRLVTRRMYEQRLDQVFGARQGGRVMQHARRVGLVATCKQGKNYDRPLMPMERAALILISALCAGTSLGLAEAAALVVEQAGWRRQIVAAAATGSDVVLHHSFRPTLAVELAIRCAAIRDPVLNVTGGRVASIEAA